jgi:hypothetical protein
MKTVIVRYKVKASAVEQNEALIRAVFEQLERDQPEGLRYQVFKQADGVSFVHVSAFEASEGNPLTKLQAFKHFAAGVQERCEEGPTTSELQPIGRYDYL